MRAKYCCTRFSIQSLCLDSPTKETAKKRQKETEGQILSIGDSNSLNLKLDEHEGNRDYMKGSNNDINI